MTKNTGTILLGQGTVGLLPSSANAEQNQKMFSALRYTSLGARTWNGL